MKRLPLLAIAGLVLGLVAWPAVARAQATFKIPFKFKAAGKNLPAGEYWVGRSGEGQILVRQIETGKELEVPFTEALVPPTPPQAELRLVFDEVGDFVPSYTEYITVYVLAEVWLSEKDGFRVHLTKGAHNVKTVSGVKAEK
jgi:hypothetical protein